MTRDELMALARQAGHIPDRFISASTLERFAELVAAAELRRLHAELERCKQVCAATSEGWRSDTDVWKAQRDALAAELAALKEK